MRELAAATQQAARAEGQPCLARFRALVLDVSYRPVLIVSWQRAITLSLFQKADVLETYSKTVRSSTQAFQIPAVLRVPVYISPDSSGRIALNRKNIITRDGSQCQYCGLRSGSLTIDHVMVRGGAVEVYACRRGNVSQEPTLLNHERRITSISSPARP